MGGAGTPPHSPGPQEAPTAPQLGSQNLYKVLGVAQVHQRAIVLQTVGFLRYSSLCLPLLACLLVCYASPDKL